MKNYRVTTTAVLLASLLGLPSGMAQDPTSPVVKEEESRISENQKAQQQVDRVHQETTDLVSTYQAKLKIVDGLKAAGFALLLRFFYPALSKLSGDGQWELLGGANWPQLMIVISMATMTLESMPPERNAPTGTSLTR